MDFAAQNMSNTNNLRSQETEAKMSRTRFAAQDPVPEWLLSAEPMHSQSRRGTIRFTMPTDVIDTGDYYVVVPRQAGNHPMGVYTFDGEGCQVNAASKPVETMIVKSMIVGTDYFDLRSHPDVVTRIPGPPAPTDGSGGPVAVPPASEPGQEVRDVGVLSFVDGLPKALRSVVAIAAIAGVTLVASEALHALKIFG